MTPSILKVTDIRYRRPGLNKISFEASYPGYRRRGTVVYDTIKQHFITHTADICLLSAICIGLQEPGTNNQVRRK